VLSELCRRTLTVSRLGALPATLAGRREIVALRYAVALAAGDATAPGRANYLTAMSWNLARLERLESLLAAARAAGVRLMPIKGALLSRTHYGDPGARPMADVDVACAPAELTRALELCQDLGFRRMPTPAFRSARDAVHDVKLFDRGVGIELHHRLWHELRMAREVEPLLERAREIPFGATTAWAPDDADHLYVVMLHAATHGFCGNALWLTDAALLLDGDDGARWALVQSRAEAAGARVALAAARDQLLLALPWLSLDGGGAAPLRRALLKRMAPWLQRGEGALGVWPSRLVRPLLFDRARDLGGWALEKLAMLGRDG
jgi:putative nucleotidyltransferase-like protein